MEWVYATESLAGFVDGAKRQIIGIQKDDIILKKIYREICNRIIIDNHYSHKTATDMHTLLHLGIFYNKILKGAMQYGYAMNPHSCHEIVKGTSIDEYYELNRLWISDDFPVRNVESIVIGMSFRLIKKLNPKIKWIQSFADGRVGCGTIYQASNFLFCGSHKQTFVKFNGELHHIGKFNNSKKTFSRMYGDFLDKSDTEKKCFDQYRYIYFLKKEEKCNLLLDVLPYPKIKKENI